MKKSLLALAMVAGLTSVAHADYNNILQQNEHPYVGVDAQIMNVNDVNSVTIGGIMVRAGTDFMPNFGVEAQYAYGLFDNNFTANGSKYNVKNQGSYGIFVKPHTTLSNGLDAYLLLGANYNDILTKNVTFPGAYKENTYGTSFAAGVGIAKPVAPNMTINGEFMHYNSHINALNLGMRYFF